MTHWTRAASLLSMDPQQKKRGCRRIFAVLTWKTEAESEPTMGTAIPGWAQVLQDQLLLPVVSIFDCSKWLAPSSWLVPCCWAAVHSWPPSCLPLAAPMCLLLQPALEPQQLWPRPPWWHHRQHLLMRAPCGSLLCPPLALVSPLAWLQLVRVLARALLPADALMASLASLRWQMTCEVCCCCPWHSWSPWRFMAWWLPWCSSSPTHSSSKRPNPKLVERGTFFRKQKVFEWSGVEVYSLLSCFSTFLDTFGVEAGTVAFFTLFLSIPRNMHNRKTEYIRIIDIDPVFYQISRVTLEKIERRRLFWQQTG